MSAITRRELSADVAEYSFTLQIGPGPHDAIGLHRMIKENGIRPVRPDSGIFFVHGDALGFDAAFLASAASPSIPDSRALPVFLAENDVEVWGIDQRWILVDASTTDFTFMRSWGLAMNADDVGSLAQGVYRDTTGQLISTFGRLALSSPSAPSPIVLSLSNLQAGYLAGEATFRFQGGLETAPFYHWAGGTFDADGLPTGLSFTENAYFFDFLAGAAPFMPVELLADAEAVICDKDDLPFVANLSGVTVPVLYLGAGGGGGTFGLYSLSLLGSPDQESLIVDLKPPQSRLSDFGHADLFLATDAQTLVWQPLLDWIRGVRTR
jgi:hypothetical protein